MAITSEQITNAAIRHGDESGAPEYAVGDLEIALRIALDMLESAGLADQYEAAIKDEIGLESLNEYLADQYEPT